MTTTALVMMIVAMLVIWGGLATAILNLRRSPDVPGQSETHRDP